MIKFMVANNNLSVFEGCPLPYPFGEYDGSKKQQKRMRGIPVHHNQVKSKHTIWLTPDAWNKAKQLAKIRKTSVSELIEKMIKDE